MTKKKSQFQAKREQAQRHTDTIFELLRQSRSCTSCNGQLDQNGVFSVRPHLICDSGGQRLICGKCHRAGDYGEPIRMFQHQSY